MLVSHFPSPTAQACLFRSAVTGTVRETEGGLYTHVKHIRGGLLRGAHFITPSDCAVCAVSNEQGVIFCFLGVGEVVETERAETCLKRASRYFTASHTDRSHHRNVT
ncbi:hypothetical protein SKAU_G00141540 [Synaphobranchus kaupii]|uniref:Uncharacterized protein n=1 Tax=Synaphobranchus kaupii TaxID=118154 RepID=A0A9Q1FSK9_SYNKA|nr:hypothetical protein SKAU_G00141540 [Synaphobranchus kaupii]